MKQVISLVGGAAGAPILSERLAGVAGIVAGMLVAESAGTVIKNATADALAQKLFAQTNVAVAGDIDLAYANGETVSYGAYHAGQEVNALVAAAAPAIVDGDPLASAGDGTLKKGTVATAIAYAIEAVDNSGGGTTVRIKARVA
tara:strand:+ start:760 stop:1191 length:432 start_codon:yes stop_codon:yes gene_type:complete